MSDSTLIAAFVEEKQKLKAELTSLRAQLEAVTKELAEARNPTTIAGQDIRQWHDYGTQQFIRAEKAEAFKAWTHGYLDKKGVPPTVEDEHLAAGCRIGGRMDWVFGRIEKAERERDEVQAAFRAKDAQLCLMIQDRDRDSCAQLMMRLKKTEQALAAMTAERDILLMQRDILNTALSQAQAELAAMTLDRDGWRMKQEEYSVNAAESVNKIEAIYAAWKINDAAKTSTLVAENKRLREELAEFKLYMADKKNLADINAESGKILDDLWLKNNTPASPVPEAVPFKCEGIKNGLRCSHCVAAKRTCQPEGVMPASTGAEAAPQYCENLTHTHCVEDCFDCGKKVKAKEEDNG